MNTQATTQSNGAIRSVVTKENIAMFKRIAIAASAISAVAVLGFGIAGSMPNAHAEPLKEPVSRGSAAQVLRDYPLPGDPHDAVASFNELVVEISGAPLAVTAAVIRNFPLPGDPHDARFSVEELIGAVGSGEITVPALSVESQVPAYVVPISGDPHDAAVQLAEWYDGLQPEAPSHTRLNESD